MSPRYEMGSPGFSTRVESTATAHARLPISTSESTGTARLPITTPESTAIARLPITTPESTATARLPITTPKSTCTTRLPISTSESTGTVRLSISTPESTAIARLPITNPESTASARLLITTPESTCTVGLPISTSESTGTVRLSISTPESTGTVSLPISTPERTGTARQPISTPESRGAVRLLVCTPESTGTARQHTNGRTTAGQRVFEYKKKKAINKYEKYLKVDNNDDENVKREDFIKIIDGLYSDLTVGNPNNMYERGPMVGSGGQAKVYSGIHRITNKKHAIKIYKLPEYLRPTLVRQICGEIFYLGKTHHQNIVKSYECFIHDNEIWIILEYVNGISLKTLSRVIYLSESEIATIVKGLLEALQDLHSRGLVHRDVKTNNVHFATDGSVKLLDFGYCTKVTEELRYAVGNRFWASPEMFLRKGYNEKTDIWSLGISIVDITFGEVPYQDHDKDEVVDLILDQDRPPYIKEDLSPEFSDFLDKCFERNPVKRASASELLLHPFVQGTESKNHMIELSDRFCETVKKRAREVKKKKKKKKK